MKKCTKCNVDKELEEFPKNSRCRSGYNNRCKSCLNSYNKVKRNSKLKQYQLSARERYHKNIDKNRKISKEYYQTHKEEKSSYDRVYRETNKFKIADYKKNWVKSRKDDPQFKIKRNLRRRVHHVLKGTNKADSTFKLLGCTLPEFILHLEKQFSDGMTWSNYGSRWHIDHIIPCFTFDLTKLEQQFKCFHYTNQRPLWKLDNLKRPRNIWL